MIVNLKICLLTGLVLTVSACGGGSSNSSGGTSSPAPSVAISTSNSDQVASTAGSGDTITTSTTNLVPLSAGQTTKSTLNLTNFAKKLLQLTSSNSLQTLSTTISCSGGGSYTIPDQNTTSGTVTFNNCTGLAGNSTINGTVTVTTSGDLNTSYSATLTFNKFTITSGSNTISLDVSMSISSSISGTVQTTKVSYSLFKIKYNSDYVNIYNYQSTITRDTQSLDYTFTWDYTFDSSLINGAVKVSTETPITGNDNNPYPYTGSVVFTGANNSHVRISTNNSTGQSDATVLIEVDADGDGVYESNKTMTWLQFDSQTQIVLY